MRFFAYSRISLALSVIALVASCGGDTPAGPIDAPDELGAYVFV